MEDPLLKKRISTPRAATVVVLAAVVAATTAARTTTVAARGVEILFFSNGSSISFGPPGEPFLIK